MTLKPPISVRFMDWFQASQTYQQWLRSPAHRIVDNILAFCQRNWFSLQILLIMIYRLTLDLLYSCAISPLYGYSGFSMNFYPLPYACTLLAVLIFTPFITQLQGTGLPSANIVTCLNYIYFIPLTSYCGCYWQGFSFFLTAMVYWAILLVLQFRIPVVVLRSINVKGSRYFYTLLTLLCILLVMYISGRYTGFRFTLNIIDVYGIRKEAASYNLPVLISYALSMAGNILAVLLVYWLLRRKYLICSILVFIYLFLFSIAGHKSLFFFLLIVLTCYFLFRPWMRRWLPAFASLATILGVLEYRLTHSYLLAGVIFRRCMYVPVKLSEDYMTYFRDNPVTLFRNGILRHFFSNDVYSGNVANIIGAVNGDPNVFANNGLLGDLSSNLPVLLGLMLMPLILIICFRMLDATAKNLPEKLVISSCIYFAMSFSNSSWSTTLLSHGFLITCLLLYIFPKEEVLSP